MSAEPTTALQPSELRTAIVTNGNILTLLSLGEFLREHHGRIAAVFVTTRLPSQKSNVAGVIDMWRTSGWRYTHFKLLTNLLLPRSMRRRGLPGSVVEYLARLGARPEVHYAPNINQPDMVARVRELRPDILLSASATTRFIDAVTDSATRVAINVHYALLPGYAGLSPYFWYLRNQESESGSTLHRIAARLDAGPIIEQRRFSMAEQRTVFSVLLEQASLISPMLLRFYAGQTHERDATPQDLSKRSYFRHPTRDDVRALHAQGHRFYERADLQRVEQTLREFIR